MDKQKFYIDKNASLTFEVTNPPIPKDHDAILFMWSNDFVPLLVFGEEGKVYRTIGSFMNLSKDEARDKCKMLEKAMFKWVMLEFKKDRYEVIYYKLPESCGKNELDMVEALKAVNLRIRSLGLLAGPLSITEWDELMKAYGVSETSRETFVNRLVKEAEGKIGKPEIMLTDDFLDNLSLLDSDVQDLVLNNMEIIYEQAKRINGDKDKEEIGKKSLVEAAKK